MDRNELKWAELNLDGPKWIKMLDVAQKEHNNNNY